MKKKVVVKAKRLNIIFLASSLDLWITLSLGSSFIESKLQNTSNNIKIPKCAQVYIHLQSYTHDVITTTFLHPNLIL